MNITIGGKERPIHFGNEVAYSYQLRTGKKYLAEVNALLTQDLAPVAAEIGTDDVGTAAVNMDVVRLAELTFGALAYAHRKQNTPIDFDTEDVAGWLLTDMEALQQAITLLIDSIPMQATDTAKKNETPPTESQPSTLTGSNG